MANETEVIREQMEGTRTALAEKLELLEAQVTDKVQQATSSVADTVEAVSETVDSVKDTVEGTVDAVKHTFDLQWHAKHHPWAMVGGATVVGFLGSRLLLGSSRRSRERGRDRYEAASPPPARPAPAPPPPAAEAKPQQSSGGWLGWLGREALDLKKLGIGMVMGVLREVVAKAVPTQLSCPLSNAFNGLTEKFGGKPLGVSQPGHDTTKEPEPGLQKEARGSGI